MHIDGLYLYLVSLLFLWLLGGLFLVFLAWTRMRSVERTLSASYKCVSMEVLDVNIIPNYLYDDPVAYPLSDKNSFVLIRYKYTWNGKVYESRRIFPLEIEWMQPRVSSFSLFSDLKMRRLNKCFIDSCNPSQAVLFRGWSPYLRRHVIGVFVSGVLVLCFGFFLWHFL